MNMDNSDNSTGFDTKMPAIIEKQKVCIVGDNIIFNDCNKTIRLHRLLKMGDLQSYKRQFISYVKNRPMQSDLAIKETFIEFVNNSMIPT